jgi:DNA-binding response OmpR family regulator
VQHFDFTGWVRERMAGLPVMILTARDGIEDRVRGLNCGADDYMTKPFNMAELQARLHAMLRRAQLPAFKLASQADTGQGSSHRRAAHRPRRKTRLPLSGEDMELTQREWELLELLVGRSGEVVTRDDVLTAWRADTPETAAQALNSNALEVYVHRLRKKLDHSGLSIRNIRGLGYMLQNPGA